MNGTQVRPHVPDSTVRATHAVAISIRLLGAFEVTLGGTAVEPARWTRRHAASLVKLLALAPGHRLHREQVMEALWPGIGPAAGPRLHKAAHYARRALGGEGSRIVLRDNMVILLADRDLRVDADDFRDLARRALAGDSAEAVDRALAAYTGTLLPDDIYEEWADEPRDSMRLMHLELLRRAERWNELLEEDPSDEAAQMALARRSADGGDLRGALRQLERLVHALLRELGTMPHDEVEHLRARLGT